MEAIGWPIDKTAYMGPYARGQLFGFGEFAPPYDHFNAIKRPAKRQRRRSRPNCKEESPPSHAAPGANPLPSLPVATDSLSSTPLLDFDFTTPSPTLGTDPLFPSPQYFPPQSPDSLPSKPQFACTTPSQKLLGTGPLIPQYFTPQSQITPSQLGTGPVLPSAESLTPQSLFQSAEVDSREHRHLSSDTAKQLATQLVAKAQSDVAFGKKILLQLATNGGLEIKKEGCLVLKVLSLFVLHFILDLGSCWDTKMRIR
jgi:hypothetical protein